VSEAELVARAAANGDVAAFGALVRLHQSKLRGFVLRLTAGNHALADDLSQETFLEAYRKIGRYRGEGTFIGWLYAIAYSRFLMERRRRKMESLDEAEDLAAPDAGSLEKIDLERAMARLVPAERAALTLCHAIGYSNEEAAEILNLPLGTLKSHVLRGREKLRTLLSGDST
jgi:RNA polymerase sigma-70 factor (ECF subfamily)